MFTTPISEITYEDVESFCDEWPEGVRVEYKREMNLKKQIPKIVSSFANTYGGLFLIGVEANQTNNQVISIPGIPQRNGIEEQIVQSALTGIYPAVIPEVKILDVPNTTNVVVVVRVDESLQAPHAIQNSTRIYIRSGSITEPYELADIERIEYMLKRREDSQVFAKEILNRIEQRVHTVKPYNKEYYSHGMFPTFTVTACPVFPYRPLISASKIYESHQGPLQFPKRVTGGHFCYNEKEYFELNEYGIVFNRVVSFIPLDQGIDCEIFLYHIKNLIQYAKALYEDCEYQGNIKVKIDLQRSFNRTLMDKKSEASGLNITRHLNAETRNFESEIRASKQCLARDLMDENEQKKIVEELTWQLLWAFNIPTDKPHIRGKIRKRIEALY